MLKHSFVALVVLTTFTSAAAVEAKAGSNPYSMATNFAQSLPGMSAFYGTYGGHYGPASALQNSGLPNTAFGAYGATPTVGNTGFTYQFATPAPVHPHLPYFFHPGLTTLSKSQNYTQFGPNSFGPYPFTGQSSQLPKTTPMIVGQHPLVAPNLSPYGLVSRPGSPVLPGMPSLTSAYGQPLAAYQGAGLTSVSSRGLPLYHYQPALNFPHNQGTYFPSPYGGLQHLTPTVLPVSRPLTPYFGNPVLSTPFGPVPSVPVVNGIVSHGFTNPMTDRYAGVANAIPAPKQ